MSGSQDSTEARLQEPTGRREPSEPRQDRQESPEPRQDRQEPPEPRLDRQQPSEPRLDRQQPSEPRLDRQGRRFELTGGGFLGFGAIAWVPGVVLVLLTAGWGYALGWVLIAVGVLPTIVAVALLLSGVVARWAAHRRPFA